MVKGLLPSPRGRNTAVGVDLRAFSFPPLYTINTCLFADGHVSSQKRVCPIPKERVIASGFLPNEIGRNETSEKRRNLFLLMEFGTIRSVEKFRPLD
ncbi:hypothetical protein V1477_000306 [Vespula maculifrons]|uniref:Uncharacterized protein n=1 Tax=Vespula maculifrons TaxID=7453 RepID=A0ABD2D181_VESMC